jgi:glycosyltransferase involved in cell wall biosynthesis
MGEKILPQLVFQIDQVMNKMEQAYEIILVDDRSPDNSWQVMQELAKNNEQLKVYRLSRNFGQHPTIMAGLTKAAGEWIVVMDCDLQDQPKEIEKLYKKALEGFDVVQAKRTVRKDKLFKRMTSYLFSKIFNYLSQIKLDYEIANFGIYNKKVIKGILNMNDYVKSFPLFVYFVGFNRCAIEVEHAARKEGKSNYNFTKLLHLAFNSIIAYSNKPLKLFVNLGLSISFLSFFMGIYYLYTYFVKGFEVPGFATMVISIFFLSGLIICAIGILGIYLGRVFEQTKKRPVYIFDEN